MGCCFKPEDDEPVTEITPLVKKPVRDKQLAIQPLTPQDKDSRPVTSPPVRVSVQDPGERTQTETFNTALPDVFYVIVGLGPAAVINHTTLKQSEFGKKRTRDLPVLHIGFCNPWSRYFEHGMGQPNYLLNLPGFAKENQPGQGANKTMKDEGLLSTTFGSCVDRELARCLEVEQARWLETVRSRLSKTGWPVINGWVAWIQPRGGPSTSDKLDKLNSEVGGDALLGRVKEQLKEDWPKFPDKDIAPYRIVVARIKDKQYVVDLVYAKYIDLCNGSGRPRLEKPPKGVPTAARVEPWRDPAGWPTDDAGHRKISVATEAIRQEFDWSDGKRVCVANGGAIGLNAAERARDRSCWTDWFHNGSLLGTPDVQTFANPRNFSFLRSKTASRARTPNEDAPILDADLIAAHPRIRLGRGAQVQETTAACDITLEKGVPRDKTYPFDPPKIRDYDRRESELNVGGYWETGDEYGEAFNTAVGSPLPSRKYDYLILHQGLNPIEIGQPKQMLDQDLNPIPDTGAMVALASADGLIRVLGAAAQMATPAKGNTGATAAEKMTEFRKTLAISAVPDGFILSGINIAKANQFFVDFPNTNVNSLTIEEIREALGPDLVKHADAIFDARHRNNGYDGADDLITKVFPTMLETEKQELKVALEKAFRFAY